MGRGEDETSLSYILLWHCMQPCMHGLMFLFHWKYKDFPPLSARSQPLLLCTAGYTAFYMTVFSFNVPCPVVITLGGFFIPLFVVPIFLRIQRLYWTVSFERAIRIEDPGERLTALLRLSKKKGLKRQLLILFCFLLPKAIMTYFSAAGSKAADDWETGVMYDSEELDTCVSTEGWRGWAGSVEFSAYCCIGLYLNRRIKHLANADNFGIHRELSYSLKFCVLSPVFLFCCNAISDGAGSAYLRLSGIGFNAFIILLPALQARALRRMMLELEAEGGLPLIGVLEDDEGYACFRTHLEKEFSSENLHFWERVIALHELAQEPAAQQEVAVKLIYDEFISSKAPLQVNVSSASKKELEEQISREEYSVTMFDNLQSEVYDVMSRDSYFRFRQDPQYKDLEFRIVARTKSSSNHHGGSVSFYPSIMAKSERPEGGKGWGGGGRRGSREGSLSTWSRSSRKTGSSPPNTTVSPSSSTKIGSLSGNAIAALSKLAFSLVPTNDAGDDEIIRSDSRIGSSKNISSNSVVPKDRTSPAHSVATE